MTRFAEASKKALQRSVVLKDAYPGNKEQFIKATIQTTANPELEQHFRLYVSSASVFIFIVSPILQVSYARNNVLHGMYKKAHSFTASLGLPGHRKAPEIQKYVQWLLQKNNFKYGGLNPEVNFLFIPLFLLIGLSISRSHEELHSLMSSLEVNFLLDEVLQTA